MDRVVISVGGSVLVPDEDPGYIRDLADLLKDVSDGTEIIAVVGGGRPSRYYVGMGRALGGTDSELDGIGIAITRVNAELLVIALGDRAYRGVPTDVGECLSKKTKDNIVVMGGTEPGHTTDAVSAMIAREWGADRIVNASNIDAVYSEDPRENPDAERFGRITIDGLRDVIYKEHKAARSSIFDPMGVAIAKESKVDLLMVNGRDLPELRNAILGRGIKGTFVDSHRFGREGSPCPILASLADCRSVRVREGAVKDRKGRGGPSVRSDHDTMCIQNDPMVQCSYDGA